MSNWTQAVCIPRWNMMRPERPVDPQLDPMFDYDLEHGQPCCFCKRPGCVIYIRIDPATVPYPVPDDKEEGLW